MWVFRHFMRALVGKTFLGGAALVMVGGAFLSEALSYTTGTARNMGPGYFPALVSGLLMLVGAAILFQGLVRATHPPQFPVRPIAAISIAIGIFGATITTFGLIPAIAGTVIATAFAEPVGRPFRIAALAVLMCLIAWAVFVLALGLPLFLVKMPR
jgi:hypothetical protein